MLKVVRLIIILLPTYCFSQGTVIKGIITDNVSKENLPGVNITYAEGKGTVTDEHGYYSLSLSPGKYTLKYSYIGYKDSILNVAIAFNEIIELDIALQASSTQIQTLVVSAGKFEQSLSDITVSMEIIKPGLIESKNVIALDEALQQTPGLIIVDQEPQIRSGSGYSFGAGSRVMVLMDDLPILSGDIGRPTWSFLPIENVNQVEVIKGASSVLYGSGALSGVINLRTAFPGGKPLTKINIFTGIYSAPQSDENLYWREEGYEHIIEPFNVFRPAIKNPMLAGASFLHSRKAGRFDITVGGNFLSDMGHIGPYYNRDANGNAINYDLSETGDTIFNKEQDYENRARVNGQLRYRFKNVEGLSAGVNFNVSSSASTGILLWQSVDSGLYRPGNGALTKTLQHAFTIDPYVEYNNKRGLSQDLKFRYFSLDNKNDNNQSNLSDVVFAEYRLSQNMESLGISGLRLTTGIAGNFTESRAELYQGNAAADGESYSDNVGIYLQADQKFGPLSLSGGFRYEWFSVNDYSANTGIFRFGANYQLAEATFLRSSFGQGYRFPTIGERYINTAVGIIKIFPNPDLQPEKSFNTEFGIKQGFKIGKLSGYADVALFYQEYENYIEFTFGLWGNDTDTIFAGEEEIIYPDVLNSIGFKSVNTGKAMISGAEFSLAAEGHIGSVKLSCLLGYTFTQPLTLNPDLVYAESSGLLAWEDITYTNTSSNPNGNILKYRMQHLIKADFQMGYKNFDFGYSLRFNSNMHNIDNIYERLDDPDTAPNLFTGIRQWRNENDKGFLIMDARAGYNINDHFAVHLIVNNLFNKEYSLRPLAIDKPRVSMLKLSCKF